jgi:hypothetical protein
VKAGEGGLHSDCDGDKNSDVVRLLSNRNSDATKSTMVLRRKRRPLDRNCLELFLLERSCGRGG